MSHNKLQSLESLVGPLIVIALLCLGVHWFFFGEQEGSVDFADCRQKIELKDGESGTFLKKFTCELQKTKDGKVMSGICAHIETEAGKCTTAYVYDKKPEVTCKENQELTYEGSCECKYGFINKGDTCVSNTDDCISKYGSNSYGNSNGDSSTCYCNNGYAWNSTKTSCVSKESLDSSCVSTFGEGSYSTTENGKNVCDCSTGYEWNATRKSCVSKTNLDTFCKTTYGSNSYYGTQNKCACSYGYTFNTRTNSCIPQTCVNYESAIQDYKNMNFLSSDALQQKIDSLKALYPNCNY